MNQKWRTWKVWYHSLMGLDYKCQIQQEKQGSRLIQMESTSVLWETVPHLMEKLGEVEIFWSQSFNYKLLPASICFSRPVDPTKHTIIVTKKIRNSAVRPPYRLEHVHYQMSNQIGKTQLHLTRLSVLIKWWSQEKAIILDRWNATESIRSSCQKSCYLLEKM